MKFSKTILTASLLGAATMLQAEVQVNGAFSDHMVLQRNTPAAVYGKASPNEAVKVSINGQTITVNANEDGKFLAMLDSMSAGGPYTLVISGKDNEVTINDVMVGEVWLCSGQSNMWWTMERNTDGKELLKSADNNNIRFLNLPQKTAANPSDVTDADWEVCTPESAKLAPAIGYFFANHIVEDFDVPVGIIASSWSGTPIQPWIPASAYMADDSAQFEDFRKLLMARDSGSEYAQNLLKNYFVEYDEWRKDAELACQEKRAVTAPPAFPADLSAPIALQNPSTIHNKMIEPLLPYTIKGVLWYQGEANIFQGSFYTKMMKMMVDGWRKDFNNPEMPFLYVQVAPHNNKLDPMLLPTVWLAQQDYEDLDANAHMVVINDSNSTNDIHPPDKRMVTQRLYNMAKKYAYNMENIDADFPRFNSMEAKDNQLILTFRNVNNLAALHDGKTGFEISDAAGHWYDADMSIDGNKITLTAEGLNNPYKVRYNIHQTAEANVINKDTNLPLGPFMAGETPVYGNAYELYPELKDYSLAYRLNPAESVMSGDLKSANYAYKNLDQKPFSKLAYFVELCDKEGNNQHLLIELDAFTDDINKIALPTVESGALFQIPVTNVKVSSNSPNLTTGNFATGCNIEFFPSNYGIANELNVPNSRDDAYDSGDSKGVLEAGYGSFQFHNNAKKETIFAYNAWQNANNHDIGIGSAPTGHSDWTLSGSSKNLEFSYILVFVK